MVNISPPAAVTMDQYNKIAIFSEVDAELGRAAKHPPFNSAHEGYAVILEELDELKAHAWRRQGSRNVHEMRAEAIQVAAMAVKFIQMLDATGGQK